MNSAMEKIMDGVQWKALNASDQSATRDFIEAKGTEQIGLHATHEGALIIGGYSFKCYQLSDGQRVFDAESVEKFLGLMN